MSADNIGTHFVDDLVNMALTAKRVPELEAQVRNLQTADELNAATIVELNKQIIDHVNAHAETKATLQAEKEARETAEYKFLEADDAKGAALRTLEGFIVQAQNLIDAVTPPKPVEPKPDYTGKWLTDVADWHSITLNDWIERNGATDKFTVVKPSIPMPAPAVESPLLPIGLGTGTQGQGVEDPTVSPTQTSSSETVRSVPSSDTVKTHTTEGVSVPPNPPTTTVADNGASSMTTQSGSAATSHAEPVAVVPTSVERGFGGILPKEGSVQPNPTAETLLGSSSLTAPSTCVGETSVAALTSTSEPTEVAHTGPFAPMIESQSANALTGDAETKESASSQTDERSYPDYWAKQSHLSQYR